MNQNDKSTLVKDIKMSKFSLIYELKAIIFNYVDINRKIKNSVQVIFL